MKIAHRVAGASACTPSAKQRSPVNDRAGMIPRVKGNEIFCLTV